MAAEAVAEAVSAASAAVAAAGTTAAASADAVAAASQAAAAPGSAAAVLSGLYWFVMVPMVYLAVIVLVAGIVGRVIAILRAPPQPFSLKLHPAAKRPGLAALRDAFTMPQVRTHAPLFWVFLMIYHVAFLLLIVSHLDLFPRLDVMPSASKHMVGWGAVGVAVTVSTFYFIMRRFRGENRRISIPADYLLLLTFLFGDFMSWSNSWGPRGFVMTKQDFAKYFEILGRFSFADPRTVLRGSHYHFVVIHVLLANLTMIVLPFTKVIHTFFSMPINLLRRR
jgi:nitrate reductase gamma subunit